jgi:hypothetical protein
VRFAACALPDSPEQKTHGRGRLREDDKEIQPYTSRFVISYVVSPVARLDKLIESIRNNPKEVRFEDACKVAEGIGFSGKGGKGSHNSFSRTGERIGLNFQRRGGGKIMPYQARQLIAMIDKYYVEDDPGDDGHGKDGES